mgnify:FL=1
MPLTIHGNMSGKNGISMDRTVFLSLLAGETRLCPDKSPTLRRANAHQLPPGRGHCSTKARCSLCRQDDTRAVADNTLVQSELKVLPVPICGQVKPSYACLSAPCLPPPKGHECRMTSLLRMPVSARIHRRVRRDGLRRLKTWGGREGTRILE